MKRVLALAAAVALVAGAVFLRGALDDKATDVTSGPDTTAPDDGSPLVVACAPELRAICEAMVRDDVLQLLTPAQVLSAMEAGDDLDAWVTFDPWPDVLANDDDFDDRFQSVVPVAATDLVLVTRTSSFDGACQEAPEWACVVEQRPRRIALPGVGTTLGPLVLGWAAHEWNAVARDGEPFARQDFDIREFQAWLGGLDVRLRDPLAEALQLGPTGPLAIGTTGIDADRIASTRERGNLVAHPGASPATVAVVVAGPARERIAGEPTFQQALEAAGWTLGDARSRGLPTPGLIFALQQEASR